MRGPGQILTDLILPPRCGLCGEFMPDSGALAPICADCLESLTQEGRSACRICGGILDGDRAGGEEVCRDCRKNPPPFARAAPAALFSGHLAEAVRDLKYRRRVELAPVLGRIAAEVNWPSGFPAGFDLIIPVPLHVSRLKARGFNQAALICRSLKHLGPVELDLLVRIRKTRPQVELDGRARQENVKQAFGLKDPQRVRGTTALLVDDVITTGATCRECASVLKRAGAERVLVRSLAGAVGF